MHQPDPPPHVGTLPLPQIQLLSSPEHDSPDPLSKPSSPSSAHLQGDNSQASAIAAVRLTPHWMDSVEVGPFLTSLVLTRPNAGQSSVRAEWLQKDSPRPLWAHPSTRETCPHTSTAPPICREMLSCTQPTTRGGLRPLPGEQSRHTSARRACTETECFLLFPP